MTNYTKPVFGVSPFCYSEKAKDFQKGDIVKMKQLVGISRRGDLQEALREGKIMQTGLRNMWRSLRPLFPACPVSDVSA